MTIFNFDDYKEFYNSWVNSQPKQGHGEYRRLAQALGVSSTMVSQVFKGDKHISLEMASDMADYLSLSEEESEFFLLLVEYAKAGSFKLKKRLERQVKQRKEHFKKLENRIKKEIELSEETKAIYYSSWLYSGIRLLTDIQDINHANDIAQRLQVPKNQVQKILDFLVQHGLVAQSKGAYKMGPTRVFIGSSNHLVARHHQNWRLQGFQKMIQAGDDSFFYTAPMVLSSAAAEKIRQELPAFIEKIVQTVKESDSEVSRCLNIDWFEF